MRGEMPDRGAEDRQLTVVQLGQIFWFETPLDFGIAGERAGARAGDVGKDAVELSGQGEMARIGDESLNWYC